MYFYRTEKGKTLMRENIRETQAFFTQCTRTKAGSVYAHFVNY